MKHRDAAIISQLETIHHPCGPNLPGRVKLQPQIQVMGPASIKIIADRHLPIDETIGPIPNRRQTLTTIWNTGEPSVRMKTLNNPRHVLRIHRINKRGHLGRNPIQVGHGWSNGPRQSTW